MTAIFKIDQPGAVPPVVGIWDRASRDVQLVVPSGPVTFTAHDVMLSYHWELISEPPGPPTPIVGANLPACQVSFTKTGGYIMRLTVDAGIPATEDVSERYVGIRLPNSNLPIPAFNELDFDNSISPFTGELGSSEKLTEFFKWLDAHSGGGGSDWTVEFVTANRVLNATDHKKTLIVLVDTPNTITITLPNAPFVAQEIRIIHGGQLTYPGPGPGHLEILKSAPGDKGIGIADSDYGRLDADFGGAVTHLLCIDSGGGYWGSRFWAGVNGSGVWYDYSHLGVHPAPPYDANQFFLNFQSPFRAGAGGHSAIQLYEQSAVADGIFSFAFGYVVNTSKAYSLAFGHLARTNWVGESAFASGGFFSWGSAQRSEVNLYGETTPMAPSGEITPTGTGGLPLTVESEKVYACELLIAAVRAPYLPMDPPLAASWKMEFLVHGRDLGQNAVIVGTTNKTQLSRDPSPIIDTWDVNVSMGGSGLFATDILVTVTQGADAGGAVRWDAVLRSAQVVATIPT